jgi:hypothetical protein
MPVYQFGFGNAVGNLDPETCQLTLARSLAGSISPTPAPTGNPPTFLDAGALINLTSSASMQPLQQGPSGTYDGSLGMLFSMVGVPPMGTLFLQPGTITADNGGGGADVASFMASLTLPDPAFSFDNIDQIASIVGSQGVTVQWSGGDPNGFVTITGTSNVAGSAPGSATLVASWSCSERISAGQFTVPPWITASMPIPQANAAGSSAGLSVSTYVANRVNIATLDLAMFASTVTIVRTVTLQ